MLIRTNINWLVDKVREEPTRSISKIYEEVRTQFAGGMDSSTKLSFLQEFPVQRSMSSNLYNTRREVIPADPKKVDELNVDLEWFLYSKDGESVVKGDQVGENGKRVLLFSSDDHLELLARSPELLSDATFKITPKLWYQTFIIMAAVCGAFIPVVFCLMPDKKRQTYDMMFSLLKEALECRGLELSAELLVTFQT